ncbi:hypothetical protein FisN_4Lh206 [Fistulifera solaris]|uniref:PDZ domain-containing protein n=1 Tax=Fistulifera solaris TaxID=1519565 RepID=A0A1Z5JZ58_FISSO|nr:hypothetical protein FisN_4Lh206 [Fistulifera solaris]|eukprot:GAX19209.1 hypothetical protein FisN_4Lh206 [Fistulifera solaris]
MKRRLAKTQRPICCPPIMRAMISLLLLQPVLPLSSPFGGTTKNVATQILQGAGPASVDMDLYNIPRDEIVGEWKANFVQKANENTAKVALACQSPEYFIDSITINFPRNPEEGLGLSLVELAGGRGDGLGITIVSEVSGAAASAEGASILYGDSVAVVGLVRTAKKLSEGKAMVEEYTIATECLDYEATVEAISSLPPANAEDFEDTWVLKVKRIRRKPKISVRLLYPPSQNEEDVTLELFAGENLRQGMLVRGVKLNDPLAKRFDTKNSGNCGAGGLCRTCSVVVQSGIDLLNPQRVSEKQMLADSPRWRLACKAIVGYGMKEGEMTIRVNPNQW